MGAFGETEPSVTVYRLPTKKKKHLFSFCSKQTKVWPFSFFRLHKTN
jgi:hypothetical protein